MFDCVPVCLVSKGSRQNRKIKKVKFFTRLRGWGGLRAIFTLFILCLEWPNKNGLIRPEMQRFFYFEGFP